MSDREAVEFPHPALLQLILFVIGVGGPIAHFAPGDWLGTWLAALVILAGIVMFAANMIPCLAPSLVRAG
ncbi:MAG: hypothetical protein WA005_13280 [Candidatus Binataceae bacterium]